MLLSPSFAPAPWLVTAVVALIAGPVLAAEDKPDPAATREYAVAAGLQSKQLYDQAARRWQKFIETYPRDPRLANAYHHLGSCQLGAEHPIEAAATFRTLIDKCPRFESLDAAHFNLGLALYNAALTSKKADDFRTAGRAFAEVPARFAKSKQVAAALHYQGECLYRAGAPAEAVVLYRKVIAEHPGSEVLPDAYYSLGTTQEELAQDREAASTFQGFLDKFPKDRLANECRLRLGLSLSRQKRYAEAMKLFEQTAGLPDFPLADFALFQQAQCARELKQLPQAAAVYETLPRKFPTSARAGPALLEAGKCWYEAGDLPRAEAALTSALTRKFDEAAEASYWLGQVLLKKKRPAEAVGVLDRALAAHPHSPRLPHLVFLRINALYEQPERRKEAAALYGDFVRDHPGHELGPRALYLAALAALEVRDHPAAQRQAARFLEQFPRHELTPEVLFIGGEANLAAASPDPERAEALFRRLLTEFPKHKHAASCRVRVGLCLYLTKKYADAVMFLTQAARDLSDPTLVAESQLLIGRSLHDAGRPTEATAALQKALQAKPNWERGDEVLLALAQCLRAQKKYDETAAQLRRLPTAYPKSPLRAHALVQLGQLAQEQNKPEEALSLYEQTVAQFPGSDSAPAAQHAIGMIRFAKGEPAKAILAFDKLLDTYPMSPLKPQALYTRGLAHRQLGEFEPAVKDLTAFLATVGARSPDHAPSKDALDARYALALCQTALKRHEEAASTLATLLKEKPDYDRADQVFYEMGHCLLPAKKDREAAEAFRQAATKKPDGPLAGECWFRVGEYHEGAGQLPEAVQAYTAGLEKAKPSDLREKLRYKLGWVQFRREKFDEAASVLLAQIKERPKGDLSADATYLAGDCLFRQNKFAEARPLFEQLIEAKDRKYLDRSLYRCGACLAGLKEWAASQ
jgi:TolA-binding protein